MKTIKHFFTFLLFGLLAAGCANKDDYSAPDFACNDQTEGLTANMSGSDVYALANSTLQQFPKDGEALYLEAYITSSDKGGNFFKSLSMEAADGKGLSISVDMYNTYTKGYEVGRKVFIKLNGLYYIINHSSLSLGALYINPNTQAKNTGRIPEKDVANHILLSCNYKSEAELTHEITVGQSKNNNFINKLIKLNNVEFTETGVPYYDPSNVIGGSTNRNIKDINNATVIFRTGSFATYAGDIIPAKSGSVTGVMTKFNSDFQFVARDKEDIVLDQLPLSEQPEPEPEIPTDPVNLLFAGADFENWTTFNASLNSFGLKSYAVQANGAGVNGGSSLHLNGTPTANDYVFTALASAQGSIPDNPTKITFWVKGTSAKSLSLNVYRSTSGYDVFNIGDLGTSPAVLYKAAINSSSGNGTNGYIGTINTNNQWVKITLDISDVNLNTGTTGDLFALKTGSNAAYDLHIDNIEIE